MSFNESTDIQNGNGDLLVGNGDNGPASILRKQSPGEQDKSLEGLQGGIQTKRFDENQGEVINTIKVTSKNPNQSQELNKEPKKNVKRVLDSEAKVVQFVMERVDLLVDAIDKGKNTSVDYVTDLVEKFKKSLTQWWVTQKLTSNIKDIFSLIAARLGDGARWLTGIVVLVLGKMELGIRWLIQQLWALMERCWDFVVGVITWCKIKLEAFLAVKVKVAGRLITDKLAFEEDRKNKEFLKKAFVVPEESHISVVNLSQYRAAMATGEQGIFFTWHSVAQQLSMKVAEEKKVVLPITCEHPIHNFFKLNNDDIRKVVQQALAYKRAVPQSTLNYSLAKSIPGYVAPNTRFPFLFSLAMRRLAMGRFAIVESHMRTIFATKGDDGGIWPSEYLSQENLALYGGQTCYYRTSLSIENAIHKVISHDYQFYLDRSRKPLDSIINQHDYDQTIHTALCKSVDFTLVPKLARRAEGSFKCYGHTIFTPLVEESCLEIIMRYIPTAFWGKRIPDGLYTKKAQPVKFLSRYMQVLIVYSDSCEEQSLQYILDACAPNTLLIWNFHAYLVDLENSFHQQTSIRLLSIIGGKTDWDAVGVQYSELFEQLWDGKPIVGMLKNDTSQYYDLAKGLLKSKLQLKILKVGDFFVEYIARQVDNRMKYNCLKKYLRGIIIDTLMWFSNRIIHIDGQGYVGNWAEKGCFDVYLIEAEDKHPVWPKINWSSILKGEKCLVNEANKDLIIGDMDDELEGEIVSKVIPMQYREVEVPIELNHPDPTASYEEKGCYLMQRLADIIEPQYMRKVVGMLLEAYQAQDEWDGLMIGNMTEEYAKEAQQMIQEAKEQAESQMGDNQNKGFDQNKTIQTVDVTKIDFEAMDVWANLEDSRDQSSEKRMIEDEDSDDLFGFETAVVEYKPKADIDLSQLKRITESQIVFGMARNLKINIQLTDLIDCISLYEPRQDNYLELVGSKSVIYIATMTDYCFVLALAYDLIFNNRTSAYLKYLGDYLLGLGYRQDGALYRVQLIASGAECQIALSEGNSRAFSRDELEKDMKSLFQNHSQNPTELSSVIDLFGAYGRPLKLLSKGMVTQIQKGKLPGNIEDGVYLYQTDHHVLHPIVVTAGCFGYNLKNESAGHYLHQSSQAAMLYQILVHNKDNVIKGQTVRGMKNVYDDTTRLEMYVHSGSDKKKIYSNISNNLTPADVVIYYDKVWAGVAGTDYYADQKILLTEYKDEIPVKENKQDGDLQRQQQQKDFKQTTPHMMTHFKGNQIFLNQRQALDGVGQWYLKQFYSNFDIKDMGKELNPHVLQRYTTDFLICDMWARLAQDPIKSIIEIAPKPKSTLNILIRSKCWKDLTFYNPVIYSYDLQKNRGYGDLIVNYTAGGGSVNELDEKVVADTQFPEGVIVAVDCVYYGQVYEGILNSNRQAYLIYQEVPAQEGTFHAYSGGGYVQVTTQNGDFMQLNVTAGNDKLYFHRRVSIPYGFISYTDRGRTIQCLKRIPIGDQVNMVLCRVGDEEETPDKIEGVQVLMNQSILENLIIGPKLADYVNQKVYPNLIPFQIKNYIQDYLDINDNSQTLMHNGMPKLWPKLKAFVSASLNLEVSLGHNELMYAVHYTNQLHKDVQSVQLLQNTTIGEKLANFGGRTVTQLLPESLSVIFGWHNTKQLLFVQGRTANATAGLQQWAKNNHYYEVSTIFLMLIYICVLTLMYLILNCLRFSLHFLLSPLLPQMLQIGAIDFCQLTMSQIGIAVLLRIMVMLLEKAARYYLRIIERGFKVAGRSSRINNPEVLIGDINELQLTHAQVARVLTRGLKRAWKLVTIRFHKGIHSVQKLFMRIWQMSLKRHRLHCHRLLQNFPSDPRYMQKYLTADNATAFYAVLDRLLNPVVLPNTAAVMGLKQDDIYTDYVLKYWDQAVNRTRLTQWEDYLAQVESAKQHTYRQGWDNFKRLYMPMTYKLEAKSLEKIFLRVQAGKVQLDGIKARSLMNPSKEQKAVLGLVLFNMIQVMHTLEIEFKKDWIADQRLQSCCSFVHGSTMQEQARQQEHVMHRLEDPMLFISDVKNYDAHQSSILFELFLHPIIDKLRPMLVRLGFNRPQIKIIMSMLKKTKHKVKIMNWGRIGTAEAKLCLAKFEMDGITFTGNCLTTFGNTHLRIAIQYAIAKKAAVEKKFVAKAAGDDNQNTISKNLFGRFIEQLHNFFSFEGDQPELVKGVGMQLREVQTSRCKSGFLSRLMCYKKGKCYMSRDPMRTLHTGTQSSKVPLHITEGSYNRVITGQLRSWGVTIPWVKSLIDWREKNLRHDANKKEEWLTKFSASERPYLFKKKESENDGDPIQAYAPIEKLIQGLEPEAAIQILNNPRIASQLDYKLSS